MPGPTSALARRLGTSTSADRRCSSSQSSRAAASSPEREVGFDGEGEQLDGPQAVVSEHPQPATGGGTGQLGIAPLQVQPGRREERLEGLVLPDQQHLGFGQAALADPQVGEGDGGVPAGHGHGRFEIGDRAGEDGFGVTPAPELHEQRGLHAVAMAGQEARRRAPGADAPPLTQQVVPRVGPAEVGREVAGGEERAHGLADDVRVVGRAAGQGHGLVEQGHPFGQATGLDVGQAGIGQGLGLEVHVAEAAGPVQRELRRSQQAGGIVDVAPHRGYRHPPLLEAGWFVGDEAPGPREPGPAGRDVAQAVGERLAQASTRHGRGSGVASSGVRPDGCGEVRDHALEIEAPVAGVRRLERPFRLLRAGHRPKHRAPGWAPSEARSGRLVVLVAEADPEMRPARMVSQSRGTLRIFLGGRDQRHEVHYGRGCPGPSAGLWRGSVATPGRLGWPTMPAGLRTGCRRARRRCRSSRCRPGSGRGGRAPRPARRAGT